MSKFLGLVSENTPDKINSVELLHDLVNLLSNIGYKCKKTKDGFFISGKIESSAPEEEEEGGSDDRTAQAIKSVQSAVGIISAADKALPDQSFLRRNLTPRGRRVQAAKDSALDSLAQAITNASSIIKQSATIR